MMAVSYTYATLTAAIINQMHESDPDGTEFEAETDDLIARGETKVLQDLNLEIFDTTGTGSFNYGVQTITKPSGTLVPRTLSYVSTGTTRVIMLPRPYEYLLDYWPTSGSVGLPKYFAELNDTQWYIAPSPNGIYAWTARFIKRPDGLSSTNTTTWLGTNVGDLLLYACLASAEAYLEADDRIQVWKNEYMERLAFSANEFRALRRMDYSPTTAAPQPKQER